MISRKTISVWLVAEDGENKGKILLQKRSLVEKNFPNICQATWAGKVDTISDRVEEAAEAMERECLEELGEKFYNKFNFDSLSALPYSSSVNEGTLWECFNYLGKINEDLLSLVKMHAESYPEFIFVGKDDKFYPIKSKIDPEINVVLFNDQYEILKNIINKY